MGDDDRDRLTPSLELPKLFGRKPKPAPAEPEPHPETEPIEPPTQAIPVTEPDRRRFGRKPMPAPAADDDDEPTVADAAPATHVIPVTEAGSPLFVDEVAEPAPAPQARRPRRPLPHVAGPLAAGLTGLVVGLAIVGLTAAALRGCEAVRGTSTCGSPAGFLLLVAILVAMIYAGGLLLRLARVPDPGSTSSLAVGLVAVVALLFLLDYILNWWMVLVIPPISMLTFLGAHWVTTAFVEPSEIRTADPDREDTKVDPSRTL